MLLHTGRFELKDSNRITGGKDIERFGVVQWNMVNINIFSRCFFNQPKRFLDDSKPLQTEEVHFNQTGRFDYVPGILCNHNLFGITLFRGIGRALFLGGCQRNHFAQFSCRYNYATGVYSGAANAVFHASRIGEYLLFQIGAVFRYFLEFGDVFYKCI